MPDGKRTILYLEVGTFCLVASSRFAEWLRQHMEAAGYPADGPRAGGRARLAKDSGLDESLIGRYLEGTRVPSSTSIAKLIGPLDADFAEAMVAAGHLPEDTPLGAARRRRPPKPDASSLTTEELLAEIERRMGRA